MNKIFFMVVIVCAAIIVGSLSGCDEETSTISSVAENNPKIIKQISVNNSEDYGTFMYSIPLKTGQERAIGISVPEFDFQVSSRVAPKEQYCNPSVRIAIKNNSSKILKITNGKGLPLEVKGSFTIRTAYYQNNKILYPVGALIQSSFKPGEGGEYTSLIPETATTCSLYVSYNP